MKYFPLKTTVICIIATPVMYVLALMALENYFDRTYKEGIENILIGDTKSLLDGAVSLEERIATNIDVFLRNNQKISALKLKIKIQVVTENGRILYPLFQDIDTLEQNLYGHFDRAEAAQNNFELLNQGLKVVAESDLSHGSRVANLVLVFFFGVATLVFFAGYLKAREKTEKMISDYEKKGQDYKETLSHLNQERLGLFENMKALNAKYEKSKEKAKINEDELFDEIISLEEQLKSFIELKRNKDNEISELKSQVEKYERRKTGKAKRNDFDFYQKRFKTIYKNVEMHRKAVSGYLSLNEDQQIKAEELIRQLDLEPDKVVVKRKVFVGKKHKSPSFEILFAYNGRLYFRKSPNNNVEVLIIGTKNTQQKDMEFLHSL